MEVPEGSTRRLQEDCEYCLEAFLFSFQELRFLFKDRLDFQTKKEERL